MLTDDRLRITARQNLRLWLMLVLTFVTGLVDAVGYLGLDRIFTGNMTGNIVILGMGLAGEDSLPVAGPLVAPSSRSPVSADRRRRASELQPVSRR